MKTRSSNLARCAVLVFCSLALAQAQADEMWTPAASLTDARHHHTATLLMNGGVLAAGGQGVDGSPLGTVELYEAGAGLWRLQGRLASPRASHTATRLPNGAVVVAGGHDGQVALASVELYEPSTGQFRAAAAMNQPRYHHSATLLADGHVLVSGGEDSAGAELASAEIYDPAADIWQPVASMATARAWASAVLLPNGHVMVTGGESFGEILRTAEVYSPQANVWFAVGNMSERRAGHAVAALANGSVLAFGGGLGVPRTSSELYSTDSQRWNLAGGMAEPRQHAAFAQTPDGRVWVVSGDDRGSVEYYDVEAIAWMEVPSLPSGRFYHTATALPDGRLLVVGGSSTPDSADALSASSVFGSPSVPPSSPPVVDAGPAAFGAEGSAVALLGSATDADGDALTFQWSYAVGAAPAGSSCTFSAPSSSHTSITCNNQGTYVASLTVSDGRSPLVTAETSVALVNASPVIRSLDGAKDGQLFSALAASLTLTVSFADHGGADNHVCVFDWDDGTQSSVPVPAGGNLCQAPHVYTAAGVYTMRASVRDLDGGSDSRTLMVVVYFPGDGFVTGGGWIVSPAGAYVANPSATGKALFGFVSRYKRGATEPTGATVFHLQVGGFRFVSTRYDWLVVSGSKAQFVGRGLVNGVAGYDFVATVTDGDKPGEDGMDRFRIRVTGPEGLVYENSPEAGLDIDAVHPEAVSGGSIVIHP